MVAVPVESPPFEPEKRLLLSGVTWAQYVTMSDLFAERRGMHLTFLAGELEIMTTSGSHEWLKGVLGRLIEAWADRCDFELESYGAQTFRREAKERGLEPDECYVLSVHEDREPSRPDIAVEVVLSNPLVDKLEVYAGLEVPEVWVWKDGVFTAWILDGARYVAESQSRRVPGLDFTLIARVVGESRSQRQAVASFRAALDGRNAQPT